jgi:hypothetical protein
MLTWRQVDFLLQWAATILTLLGAVLTSMDLHPYNIWAFNVGTLLWLVWAVRVRSMSLIAVNAGLMTIYFAGLVKTLL